MKKYIKVESDDVEWLYSQDWEYYDYGNCKRCLQMLFLYRYKGLQKKYPVIVFILGAAWHRQEMISNRNTMIDNNRKVKSL